MEAQPSPDTSDTSSDTLSSSSPYTPLSPVSSESSLVSAEGPVGKKPSSKGNKQPQSILSNEGESKKTESGVKFFPFDAVEQIPESSKKPTRVQPKNYATSEGNVKIPASKVSDLKGPAAGIFDQALHFDPQNSDDMMKMSYQQPGFDTFEKRAIKIAAEKDMELEEKQGGGKKKRKTNKPIKRGKSCAKDMIGGADKINWNKTQKLTLEYILNGIDNDSNEKRDVLRKLEKWRTEFKDSLQHDPTDVDVEDEHHRGWNEYLKYKLDIEEEIENYDLFIKAIEEGYDDEEIFPSLEKIHNEKWHNEILGKINSINDTMAISRDSSDTTEISRASLKKKKKLTKKGKAWVKAAAKDMKKRTKKTKSSKKAKSKKKYSLKKSKTNMISKKKYNELIKKRQHHKKLTLTERKQLDHALFINYCSCIKKLKNKKTKKNLEYPICMSSIYNKRKFKSPKNVRSKCKKYK